MSFKLKINSLLTILNIEDVDGNGYYDVNDFLEMNNKEILDMNEGKKFDICLMNPPYDSKSNLHLKFLKKTNELSNNVISIQPGIWLEKSRINTPIAEYKKYFKNRVHSVEILNHDESNKLFGTGNSIASLCIINLSDDPQVDLETFGFKKHEYNLYKKINLKQNEIITFNACKGGPKNHKYGFIKTKNTPMQRFEFDVPVYTWHGGKNCYEAVIMSKERQESKKGVSFVIIFNSDIEVKNFKNSLKTKFMDWYYYNFIKPADNKIVNVMFRLKDYSKPVTDETFYKLFNLTQDEIDIIENYKYE